jgi:hypothetical protein
MRAQEEYRLVEGSIVDRTRNRLGETALQQARFVQRGLQTKSESERVRIEATVEGFCKVGS